MALSATQHELYPFYTLWTRGALSVRMLTKLIMDTSGHAPSPSPSEPLLIRGRLFSPKDLRLVVDCVSKYRDRGRTFISIEICRGLNWVQPNGWLKDRACRDVLIKLELLGVISLPPRIADNSRPKRTASSRSELSTYDLSTPITTLSGEVRLKFAKGDKYERLWNQLVDEHHYLGYKPAVGRCIKYLIIVEDRLLGAISFCSPAWQIESRDRLLKMIGLINPREQVISNSRFLVLPFVHVPNFASRALSIATRRIVDDWARYYSIRPLVAETFVQPSLFPGTCYKAANWIEIGTTKGYAKRGASYHNSQEPKKIFLYGLNKNLRVKLFNAAPALSPV